MRRLTTSFSATILLTFILAGCGNDEPGADRIGVAAQCEGDDECHEDASCLTQFKGGYCGLRDCQSNDDCPEASACVQHEDGSNYCFRVCVDKDECNRNRSEDNESNCSSSVTFVDAAFEAKACIPPTN